MRIRGLRKLLDERDWLWVSLGLAVVGRAMLNKCLIQLSADGWICALLGQTMVGLMVIATIPFKRIYASMLWLPGLL